MLLNNDHSHTLYPTRRHLLGAGSALALGGLLPATASAQAAWPSKSVRFVVPFAPGGSSEIVARSTAAELSKTLGQSVFVDNKPGAAGNIAMQEVARAEDQHTLILGHIGTLAVNPYIFDKLPYDANKDFKPVSLLAKVPMWPRISVCWSSARATSCMAMLPAAPGLLSTNTLWPRVLLSSAAVERATISELPPGAKGTTKRTDLAGHAACADAVAGSRPPRARAPPAPSRWRRVG